MNNNHYPVASEIRPLAADEAFVGSIDALAQVVPEIADSRLEIEAGGRQLIEEFAISPEFFDGQDRPLYFSALSQRLGRLEAGMSSMAQDQYTAERNFIANATIMLAGRHSGLYPILAGRLRATPELSEEELVAAYDSVTNQELSQELAAAMDDGLVDDVKRKLGITTEDQQPFRLRVLGIAGDHDLAAMPGADQRKQVAANTRGFKDAVGIEGDVPLAWVETIGDTKQLNVPLPIAQKILRGGAEQDSRERERDIAYLGHEFVHTQGGVSLDNDVFYGIGLEELRAEHFSGNRHGYQDVKAFYFDLGAVSGVYGDDLLEGAAATGDWSQVHVELANRLGVQAAMEIALLAPRDYIDDARPIQKEVNDYLGGFDACVERVYESVSADPDKMAAFDNRLTKMAQALAKTADRGEFWAANRKRLGSRFVVDKIMERMTENID